MTTKTEVSGSAVVSLLERIWDRLREDHPELPEVVIVTGSGTAGGGPGKWGHFRHEGWSTTEAESRVGEVFMAGETLAKGAGQVLQTMLHEGAHVLARVRDVQDTSRQGRWHNKTFLKLARELGLEYTATGADKRIGYSSVVLTEETRERYADLVAELQAQINLVVRLPVWLGGDPEPEGGEHIGGGQRPAGTSTPSAIKATCMCEKPRIIRLSQTTLEGPEITCSDCECPFLNRG